MSYIFFFFLFLVFHFFPPPTMSLFFPLPLSSLTAILFFYKPHIQSPGYHAVTVATCSTSHHFGALSSVVTWPPVFTGLDHGFGTSVDTPLVRRGGLKSLSHSLSLLLFIPRFSSRLALFSPRTSSVSQLPLPRPRLSSQHWDCFTAAEWIPIRHFLFDWLGVWQTQDLHMDRRGER